MGGQRPILLGVNGTLLFSMIMVIGINICGLKVCSAHVLCICIGSLSMLYIF
jgi:hypothetical protein